MTNTQPVRQRCVNIEYFFGDFAAFVFGAIFDGANGRCPFRQFNQRNPDIIDHGHQHFAQVLDLSLTLAQHYFITGVLNGTDSGHAQHAFNEFGDFRAEIALDFLQSQPAFPHRPVQNGRDQ